MAHVGLLSAPASVAEGETEEHAPARLHPGARAGGWGLGKLGLPRNRWLLLDEGRLQSLTDPHTQIHTHVHRTGPCLEEGLVRP